LETSFMVEHDPRLQRQIAEHPYPLLFATISGAHLYGFPSPDSDFDLRGVHLLPLRDVVGMTETRETVEKSGIHDGLEIDLVTHDAKKFFGLMLKKNGYVLEQLLSPLIVFTTPEHEELKAIAANCITKHHAHHYFGFAETQYSLFRKADPPHVKPLLYVYRVLLTGIHLMRTGRIEANLVRLNEEARLPYIADLIARKTGGPELGRLEAADLQFHEAEYQRLRAVLQTAFDESQLPEAPTAGAALNDLLVRLRLKERTESTVTRAQNDPRSIEVLVKIALDESDKDRAWDALSALRFKGTRDVLQRAELLTTSKLSRERSLGADILSQLGQPDRSFPEECGKILRGMLRDSENADVLCSVLCGFGYQNDPDAIPLVSKYSTHPNSDLRYATAFALTGKESPLAIETLINLTGDSCNQVRDWATFALGTQIEIDSPQIRDALAHRLDDTHDDTRAEAIVGLARRKDERAVLAIKNELASGSVGTLVIEAAELIASQELYAVLIQLREWWDVDSDLLERAIAASSLEGNS
jgi:predicted nucleotidyltransferase